MSHTQPQDVEAKFTHMLEQSGLEVKAFQVDCFKWCMEKEERGVSIEVQTRVSSTPAPAAPASHAPAAPGAPAAETTQIDRHQIYGGILALEMGLGKTIIMLGLISCNIRRYQHTLIILPLSLIDQWKQIIKKHFGHEALVYHGSNSKVKRMSHNEIWACPIVLTTYGQVSMPSPKQQEHGRQLSKLHEFDWDRIICDEAHNICHRNTNGYKGVLALNARIKWLVTGTPIQNSMKELFTLFNVLRVPECAFRETPPPRAAAAAAEEDSTSSTGMSSSTAAAADTSSTAADTSSSTAPVPAINSKAEVILKHLVYFRTKASVGISLPTLHQSVESVAWKNDSERIFASHIHSLVDLCKIEQKSIASYIVETEEQNPNTLRLKYMMSAKKACINPPLLTTHIEHFKTLLKYKAPSAAAPSAAAPSAAAPSAAAPSAAAPSAAAPSSAVAAAEEYAGFNLQDLTEQSDSKLTAFVNTIMSNMSNGNGKIVFCHYYDEIDAIEKCIRRRTAGVVDGISIARFDGRVPRKDRDSVLQTPVNVLIAQIKMCREGLNLQAHYSEVYFPLPHFNPAVEDQAIARCWRIGQQKEVKVYRFIMNNPATNSTSDNSTTSSTSASSDSSTTPAIMYSMDGYTRKVQEKKRIIRRQFEVVAL